MKKNIIFRSARVFDGSDMLRGGSNVAVEDGVIREISDRPAADGVFEAIRTVGRPFPDARIDRRARSCLCSGFEYCARAQSPVSYLAHFAAQLMRTSLDRGFTTLRDAGGARYRTGVGY